MSVVSEADKTYGDLSVAENTTDDQLSFLPYTHIKNCHLARGFSWVVFFFTQPEKVSNLAASVQQMILVLQ